LALTFGMQATTGAPIPLDFDKNAVQFLFSKSGTNYTPLGTCFGLDVARTHRPKKLRNILTLRSPITQHTRYFVTAKHVLFDTNGNLRPEIYLRVSDESGGVVYGALSPLLTNELRIITHTNRAVDIAAISLRTPRTSPPLQGTNPGTLLLKLGSVDSGILADAKSFKKRHIREGDEMFFVGLFTPFYGSKENVPICRFGRLAMLPGEPVPWGNEGGANLYLMEAQCFGGNSGSPAFFYFPRQHRGSPIIQIHGLQRSSILLAGVVKGYFRDWSELLVMNSAAIPYSSQNVGVTAIVPATYLYEMLFTEEQEGFRRQIFKANFPNC